ncbi:MAG: metalloprotease TldD [Betaproteobacteria bacterium]|nr:metalloprotease TldD [Betaproteobacteria bacterium]NBY14690.1 metalloprotease TldD [Betaproteobacteria bacterium]
MTPADAAIASLAAAHQLLLEPHGLSEQDLHEALAQIHAHRVDYADLYLQYSKAEAWSLDEGIVKTGSYSIDQGVGVRAISGEKTAFAYSDTLSPAALHEAAVTTRSIARSGGRRAGVLVASQRDRLVRDREVFQRGGPAPLYLPNDPIAALTAADKVALLMELEGYARAADPRVLQVMASLVAELDVILVMRSDGRIAADVRPLVRLSITVIAQAEGRREQGSSGGGGRTDLTVFTPDVLRGHAHEAVRQALVNLESRPAPAGQMPVVLGPGWPGVLLHEAVGHGLEGDFNRKGSSAFAGRMGQRVAAKGVTVVDDGTLAGLRGSLHIDDEGNPSQCNVLIEDGVLTGYLQDSLNARLMGVSVTGNGRRESYAHLTMPRMTNTFMRSGDQDPEEIISSLHRGLFAVNFGGGQVDITSGKFVFSASEAYWVENGRKQFPVKGATIIGNGPDALTRVTMIGNDLRLDTGVGTCGKEGQSIPVGVGQPTLRIEGLTVGGTG